VGKVELYVGDLHHVKLDYSASALALFKKKAGKAFVDFLD
jgi:hypothetical protein